MLWTACTARGQLVMLVGMLLTVAVVVGCMYWGILLIQCRQHHYSMLKVPTAHLVRSCVNPAVCPVQLVRGHYAGPPSAADEAWPNYITGPLLFPEFGLHGYLVCLRANREPAQQRHVPSRAVLPIRDTHQHVGRTSS